MKLNELIGIHHHMEILSPDVQKAQMQAEMEQLAKYRAKRISQYIAWSNPEAVAQRQVEAKRAADKAKQYTEEMIAKNPNYYQPRIKPGEMWKQNSSFAIRPLVKPKKSWWQRFKEWIFG